MSHGFTTRSSAYVPSKMVPGMSPGGGASLRSRSGAARVRRPSAHAGMRLRQKLPTTGSERSESRTPELKSAKTSAPPTPAAAATV